MQDLLDVVGKETIALVRIVSRLAGQAIFVGVPNIASIYTDTILHTNVAIKGVSSIAGHADTVAADGFAVASVVIALGSIEAEPIGAGGTRLLCIFAVDASHALAILKDCSEATICAELVIRRISHETR